MCPLSKNVISNHQSSLLRLNQLLKFNLTIIFLAFSIQLNSGEHSGFVVITVSGSTFYEKCYFHNWYQSSTTNQTAWSAVTLKYYFPKKLEGKPTKCICLFRKFLKQVHKKPSSGEYKIIYIYFQRWKCVFASKHPFQHK